MLRTSLASGDPPDIFTKWGGEVAGPLIDAGQVEEVSRYFGKYGWQQELASWAI